jgi:hypothetical protein
MESELRADSNLLQRVIAAIRDESKAVTIAQVSMIISVVFAVLSVLAIAAAFNANLRVEYQDKEIARLNENVDIYRVRYANWVALMRSKGIELPEEKQ